MSLRHPTCRVNGVPAMEAEVLVHRYQSASAFTATLSMTKIEETGGSISQWTQPQQVTITGSNDRGGGRQLISGKTDAVECDWDKRTIRIEGRDATANLIDATVDPTQDQFKNKKSEEIVREIAGRHGLSVETDGGGGGGGGQDRAGRKHVRDEFDYLTDRESAWNVIRALAERDGKVVWVEDKTLHYKSAQSANQGGGGGISIRYRPPKPGHASGNFVGLRTSKNFAAEGATMDVGSWHTRDKEAYKTDSAGGAGSGSGTGGGSGGSGSGSTGSGGGSDEGGGEDGAKAKLEIPGATQQQVQQIKKGIESMMQSHAKRAVYEGPGDVNADPRMSLTISGTGTDFDDRYHIFSIRHVFDGHGAHYTMQIDARTGGQGGGG